MYYYLHPMWSIVHRVKIKAHHIFRNLLHITCVLSQVNSTPIVSLVKSLEFGRVQIFGLVSSIVTPCWKAVVCHWCFFVVLYLVGGFCTVWRSSNGGEKYKADETKFSAFRFEKIETWDLPCVEWRGQSFIRDGALKKLLCNIAAALAISLITDLFWFPTALYNVAWNLPKRKPWRKQAWKSENGHARTIISVEHWSPWISCFAILFGVQILDKIQNPEQLFGPTLR